MGCCRPLLLLSFALATPAALTSQPAPSGPIRAGNGFWAGIGIAAGVARVGCDICRGQRNVSTSLQLRAGGSVGRTLLIGVEGNGFVKNNADPGVRHIMAGLAGVVYWYPNPSGVRYYVKAGLGPVWFRAEDSDVPAGSEPDLPITSRALGGHFGIGYELPMGRVSLTPFFNFTGSVYGSLSRDGTRLSDAGLSLIQMGFGITWR